MSAFAPPSIARQKCDEATRLTLCPGCGAASSAPARNGAPLIRDRQGLVHPGRATSCCAAPGTRSIFVKRVGWARHLRLCPPYGVSQREMTQGGKTRDAHRTRNQTRTQAAVSRPQVVLRFRRPARLADRARRGGLESPGARLGQGRARAVSLCPRLRGAGVRSGAALDLVGVDHRVRRRYRTPE